MFHDDWEIYGDGTGDPEVLMFDPARRILDVCDTYGAKYTFYAEIGQQLYMMNAAGTSRWQRYAKIWEEVLKDAIKRGHDVQLHFHPQWIGAKLKNNSWKLDYNKWNTGTIEYELLDEWIGKGASYLRNLLKPISDDYDVVSYRAGGWMCQPSSNLYKALKKHDIRCDVSVIKGRYRVYADGSKIDFSYAHSYFEPWETHPDDFAKEQKGSGIIEFPVYSEVSYLPNYVYLLMKSFRPMYYYDILKKRKERLKRDIRYSPKLIKQGKKKDYYGSFGYMHYKHLLHIVNNIKNNRVNGTVPDYIIFLTHSKSFMSYKNFENLISKLSQDNDVSFTTMRSYVKKYLTL